LKITWFAQSCIYITTAAGKNILCDPYSVEIGCKPPSLRSDIITVSHSHFDHSNVDAGIGDPLVIDSAGKFEYIGIEIQGIASYHDDAGGMKLGPNIIYRIYADNMAFVHLGDIGHVLTDEQEAALRPCDILALPVGGVYTVDIISARSIIERLNPGVVIPMHYKTPSNRTLVNGPAEFLKGFMDIVYIQYWEGDRRDIPGMTTIAMLKPMADD